MANDMIPFMYRMLENGDYQLMTENEEHERLKRLKTGEEQPKKIIHPKKNFLTSSDIPWREYA